MCSGEKGRSDGGKATHAKGWFHLSHAVGWCALAGLGLPALALGQSHGASASTAQIQVKLHTVLGAGSAALDDVGQALGAYQPALNACVARHAPPGQARTMHLRLAFPPASPGVSLKVLDASTTAATLNQCIFTALNGAAFKGVPRPLVAFIDLDVTGPSMAAPNRGYAQAAPPAGYPGHYGRQSQRAPQLAPAPTPPRHAPPTHRNQLPPAPQRRVDVPRYSPPPSRPEASRGARISPEDLRDRTRVQQIAWL